MSKFSIGIDLGTTNCAMAYVPLNAQTPRARSFQSHSGRRTVPSLNRSLFRPFFICHARTRPANCSGKGLLAANGLLDDSRAGKRPNRQDASLIRRNRGFVITRSTAARRSCHGDPTRYRSKRGSLRYRLPRSCSTIFGRLGIPASRAMMPIFSSRK